VKHLIEFKRLKCRASIHTHSHTHQWPGNWHRYAQQQHNHKSSRNCYNNNNNSNQSKAHKTSAPKSELRIFCLDAGCCCCCCCCCCWECQQRLLFFGRTHKKKNEIGKACGLTHTHTHTHWQVLLWVCGACKQLKQTKICSFTQNAAKNHLKSIQWVWW